MWFEKIFVINVPERIDRLEVVTKRIKNLSLRIPFEVFDGIVADPPPWWTLQKGMYGCHLSHRALLGKFAESDWDNMLVFEDDVFFVSNFVDKMEQLKVPDDWDMLYLGGRAVKPGPYVAPGIMKCDNINLMHAYAVNRKAIKGILEFYDSHQFPLCNDWKLGEYHPYINAYLCLPNIVGQANGMSSTETKFYQERIYV